MHLHARQFVQIAADRFGPFDRVVEIGGRDINGGVRDLFGNADYTTVDIADGPGVDVVADALTWRPKRKAHAVVCCEVLEHVEQQDELLTAAAEMTLRGGVLILTAACRPREPHSAADGGPVQAGEFYRNVAVGALTDTLKGLYRQVEVEAHRDRGDVYAVAVK